MKRGLLPLALALTAALATTGAHADAYELGEDDTGDWGANVDPAVAPLGDALGMDIESAAIVNDTPGTAEFVIRVTNLPDNGGTPDGARYFWDFLANGKFVELDGKFTNYTRGVCDPTSGQCPPPRDPGPTPFLIRGNCVTDGTTGVITCQELARVQATFDPATDEIRVPVPVSLLAAEGCASIEPTLVEPWEGTIVAVASAFFSNTTTTYDELWLEHESISVC